MLSLGLCLSVLAVPLAFWAQPDLAQAGPLATVDGQTLELSADSLELDLDQGTASLNGGVKARLGKLRLSSPRVELEYDEAPKVKTVRALGGVRATYDGAVVTSKELTIDVRTGQARLLGGVDVRRGESHLSASQATIDLKTKRLKLQRVRGSLELDHLASPAAPKAAASADAAKP